MRLLAWCVLFLVFADEVLAMVALGYWGWQQDPPWLWVWLLPLVATQAWFWFASPGALRPLAGSAGREGAGLRRGLPGALGRRPSHARRRVPGLLGGGQRARAAAGRHAGARGRARPGANRLIGSGTGWVSRRRSRSSFLARATPRPDGWSSAGRSSAEGGSETDAPSRAVVADGGALGLGGGPQLRLERRHPVPQRRVGDRQDPDRQQPALRAPPTATVATGTPAGICTIDSSESSPSRCLSGTGTPITGSGVTAASMPGGGPRPRRRR